MDENYEDYRIDVGYRMAIAPWRARSYIEGGKENFCGFAIDAAQVSGVTEAGDFIDLFCGAIAPAQWEPSTLTRSPSRSSSTSRRSKCSTPCKDKAPRSPTPSASSEEASKTPR